MATMQGINDQPYLKSDQYTNASKLWARIQLHVRFSTNRYGWMRWIFDHFVLPLECNILELGCGPGTLWQENRDRILSGWNITLSDFSPGMLAEARNTTAEISHPFKYEVIDAQAIPFPNHTVDGVIANHILYHVPNLDKAFSEIARVLKPKGVFFAATNGKHHLCELFEIITHFLPEWATVPRSFQLENGSALLEPYFTDITLDRYEDSLIVTDPCLLFEYICSLGKVNEIPKEVLMELQTFLQKKIGREGTMIITKESGMFVASRPK
jgi:ubiquinone/menaquinone biosynthesis C-methylase UbiE